MFGTKEAENYMSKMRSAARCHLNNPDSIFSNLDLNGDGEVDYLRVIETGSGNTRLIVIQAVLAKDIFQDVASISVVKDENQEVSVQIIGDEYVYGTNYIIEPIYIYRPVIYDWFWSGRWYSWYSPWYWEYYPRWWHHHRCWAHNLYWERCYRYHRHHHYCSFHHGRQPHREYHNMHNGISRRDYATRHPDKSFERRNTGYRNAGEMRRSGSTRRVDGNRVNPLINGSVRGRNTQTRQEQHAPQQRSQQVVSKPSGSQSRGQGNVRRDEGVRPNRTTTNGRTSQPTQTRSSSSQSHRQQPSGNGSYRGGGSHGSRSSGGSVRIGGGSPSRSSGGGQRSGGGRR